MSELDMGEQFGRIIEPRMESMQDKVGEKIADLIDAEMKSNVDSGKAFGSDPYDPSYSKSHAQTRRRKGLGSGAVTLQMNKKRIKQTSIETTDGATQIKFSDEMVSSRSGSRSLFRMHHEGTAKGSKTRSIWPKTPESIPGHITNKAKEFVAEVLRG